MPTTVLIVRVKLVQDSRMVDELPVTIALLLSFVSEELSCSHPAALFPYSLTTFRIVVSKARQHVHKGTL